MPVNSFSNYNLTWAPVVKKGDAPIYLTLASLLESDILAGRLPHGVKLPPQRELADFLDIDFTTVTRAYNVCIEKNLIYGITGRGTFVSPAPLEATPLSASDNGVIDFSTMAGFPMVSNGISDAIKKVASSGHLDRLFSYSNPLGSPHQLAAGRHLLASNLGTYNSERSEPHFHCAKFPLNLANGYKLYYNIKVIKIEFRRIK